MSDDAQVRVTMVIMRHHEQPGDLETGKGAHVTTMTETRHKYVFVENKT